MCYGKKLNWSVSDGGVKWGFIKIVSGLKYWKKKEKQKKNNRKCDVRNIDAGWASLAKHLKSTKYSQEKPFPYLFLIFSNESNEIDKIKPTKYYPKTFKKRTTEEVKKDDKQLQWGIGKKINLHQFTHKLLKVAQKFISDIQCTNHLKY